MLKGEIDQQNTPSRSHAALCFFCDCVAAAASLGEAFRVGRRPSPTKEEEAGQSPTRPVARDEQGEREPFWGDPATEEPGQASERGSEDKG